LSSSPGYIADDHSAEPLRAYRRIALGALLASCIPNMLPLLSGVVDLGMFALMVLHVVAWAVTVTMLTRLTVVRRRESPEYIDRGPRHRLLQGEQQHPDVVIYTP